MVALTLRLRQIATTAQLGVCGVGGRCRIRMSPAKSMFAGGIKIESRAFPIMQPIPCEFAAKGQILLFRGICDRYLHICEHRGYDWTRGHVRKRTQELIRNGSLINPQEATVVELCNVVEALLEEIRSNFWTFFPSGNTSEMGKSLCSYKHWSSLCRLFLELCWPQNALTWSGAPVTIAELQKQIDVDSRIIAEMQGKVERMVLRKKQLEIAQLTHW